MEDGFRDVRAEVCRSSNNVVDFFFSNTILLTYLFAKVILRFFILDWGKKMSVPAARNVRALRRIGGSGDDGNEGQSCGEYARFFFDLTFCATKEVGR